MRLPVDKATVQAVRDVESALATLKCRLGMHRTSIAQDGALLRIECADCHEKMTYVIDRLVAAAQAVE